MAGLLLDTHVVLWWLDDPQQIAPKAREAIADGLNDVFVSAASAWEVAIKAALGKLQAPDDLEAALAEAGFTTLPITVRHALGVRELPDVHQDPFDRILVAQARIEGLTLVTRDPRLGQYGVTVLAA
ncbi:MAG: type II toxin-antitoxin system VapC family toxin [Candidatus Latescibacterota bacterium]